MATSSTVPMTAEIEGMDTVLKNEQQRDFDHDDNNNNNEPHLTEAEKSMRDEELSFYSNSTNDYGDDNIWGLLSGIGGNIYEWYVNIFETAKDFICYTRMTTILRKCLIVIPTVVFIRRC